ncbi:MAG: hypothetical protein GY750_09335 [Lentisphaerae bacterium]|nr:hypothetical protein [Lentisphaerota bacterium]MCP4101614.1 hypothetical protein [Lentisphaerota bacterium]
MPTDEKTILALSWALVDSIRKHIPYSSDLPSLNEWYKYPDSYGERNRALVKLKSLNNPISSYRNKLETHSRLAANDTGYCEKLVKTALALLSMTKLRNVETLYASQVYTSGAGGKEHTFILLHSNPALFCRPRENPLITMNFYEFLQSCNGINAATICDPGIWLAAPATDVNSIFEQAKSYGVSEYYNGALLHKFSVRLIDLNSPEKARLSWATLQRENFCNYQKIYAKMQKDFVDSYERVAFGKGSKHARTTNALREVKTELQARQNFIDLETCDKSPLQELYEFAKQAHGTISNNAMAAMNSPSRLQALQKICSFCHGSNFNKKTIDNLLQTSLILIMMPDNGGSDKDFSKKDELPEYIESALAPLLKSEFPQLNKIVSGKIKDKLEESSQLYDYLNLEGCQELYYDALKAAAFSEADNLQRVC